MPQKSDPRFIPDSDPRFIPDTTVRNEPHMEAASANEPDLTSPSGVLSDYIPEDIKKAWEVANTPLLPQPAEWGKQAEDYIVNRSPFSGTSNRALGTLTGFAGGAAAGLGEVVSGLSTPTNLVFTLGGLGEFAAARQGLPYAARGLGYLTKAAGVPMAAHGGYNLLAPESTTQERLMAIPEIAGGMAGALHTPAGSAQIAEANLFKNGMIPETVGNLTRQAKDYSMRLEKPYTPKPIPVSAKAEIDVLNRFRANSDASWQTKPEAAKRLIQTAKDRGIDYTKFNSLDDLLDHIVGGGKTPVPPTPIEAPVKEKVVQTAKPTEAPVKGAELPPVFTVKDRVAKLNEVLPDYKTKEGYTLNELLDRAVKARMRFRKLQADVNAGVKGAGEPLQDAGKTAKATGIQLSVAVREAEKSIKPGVPLEQRVNKKEFRAEQTAPAEVPEVSTVPEVPVVEPHPTGYTPEVKGLIDQLAEMLGEKPKTSEPEPTNLSDFFKKFLQEEEGSVRIPQPRTKKGPTAIGKAGQAVQKKASWPREIYELARGTTASFDLSAPLRQGLALAGTKRWFQAWEPMVKSFGSETAFKTSVARIESLQNIKNGLARDSGLFLSDLSKNLSRREEFLRSTWAEKFPLVRASNRAYTAFLNELRAQTFNDLVIQARGAGIDIAKNPQYARQLADFVNDATGRGKYKFGVNLEILQGKTSSKFIGDVAKKGELVNLESWSPFFNNVLFSGKLWASRVRMINPGTYIFLPAQIRNQYLKSIIRMAVTAKLVQGLAKLGGAEVSEDMNSSDYGKLKFGDTRIDTAGGFQQNLVLLHRLLSGYYTSSTNPNREYELGEGFKAKTRGTLIQDIFISKLHPTAKFAWDWANASGYRPFRPVDRTLQLYVPMIVGDLVQIAREDPTLLPLGLMTGVGWGSQTYDKGQSEPVFYSGDEPFKGGALFEP